MKSETTTSPKTVTAAKSDTPTSRLKLEWCWSVSPRQVQYLAKLQCHFHGRRIIGEVEAVGGRNAVFFRSASSKRERVGCGLMHLWWDHGRVGRSFKLYFMSFLLQSVVVAFRFASCYPHTVLDVSCVTTTIKHESRSYSICSSHRLLRAPYWTFMCYDYCVNHECRNYST